MLFVNGQKVDNVVQGTTIRETLEDVLDSATIKYLSDSLEGFEMYSPATINYTLGLKDKRTISKNLPIKIYKNNSNEIITENFELDFDILQIKEQDRALDIKINFVKWQFREHEQPFFPDPLEVDLSIGGTNYQVVAFKLQHDNIIEYSAIVNIESTITFSEKNWNTYIVNYFEKHFIVAEDIATIHSRINKIDYIHTLTLIEPTKYLERITVSPQAYTNRNDKLVDQIEKALVNAEVIRVEEEPRFKISDSLRSFLGDTPGEDFFFSTPTTLRDLLDEMLSVVNARCRVNKLDDLNNIIIDYENLAEVGTEIEEFENVINRTMTQNLEYLAGNLDIYASNVEHSESQYIWHPSASEWDTFKTNEATLTTNNAFIDVRYPIDYIEGFYVSVLLDYEDRRDSFNVINGKIRVILNITERVVDMDTYNTLETTGNFSKENTIAYVRGDTTIGLNQTKRIFWTVNNFNEVIRKIFDLEKNKMTNKALWVRQIVGFGDLIVNINKFDFSLSLTPQNRYDNTPIRIKYVPFINARLKIAKDNIDLRLQNTSLYDNQTDKTLELNRFINSLKTKVDQMGDKEFYIDCKYSNLSSLVPLKTKYKNFIVTAREYQVYTNFINVRYTLSENYKVINERLNINREKRVYNIPLTFIERNLYYKEYILVSSTPKTYTNKKTLINEIMIDRLIRSIFGRVVRFAYFTEGSIAGLYPIEKVEIDYQLTPEQNVSDRHIDALLVETLKNGISLGKFLLPLNIVRNKDTNSWYLIAKFLDNYSAGYSIGNKSFFGQKVYHNPYVDSNGEFDHIKLYFLLSGSGRDYAKMGEQIITIFPGANANLENARDLPKYEWSNTNALSLNSLKDREEQIVITIQVSLAIYSEDKDKIVLGNNLMLHNHLFADLERFEDLVVYLSESPYNKSDKKAKGEIAPKKQVNILNLTVEKNMGSSNYNTIVFNGFGLRPEHTAWAIGDSKGNLYIAVNDTSVRKLYFNVADKLY